MKCPKCGREAEEGNFCPACGQRLTGTESENASGAPVFIPGAVPPQGTAKWNGEGLPPGSGPAPVWQPQVKKRSVLKIVLLAAGSVVLALLILLLVFSRFSRLSRSRTYQDWENAREVSGPVVSQEPEAPEIVLDESTALQEHRGICYEVPEKWMDGLEEIDDTLYYVPPEEGAIVVMVTVEPNELDFSFDTVAGRKEYEAYLASVYGEDDYEKETASLASIDGHKALTMTYRLQLDGGEVLCERNVLNVGESTVIMEMIVEADADYYEIQEDFHLLRRTLDCSGLEE